MRSAAFALALVVSVVGALDADACVPIRYDIRGITPAALAQEMVRDANSVELMRVTLRQVVRADRLYAAEIGSVFLFTFEPLAVLKGSPHGPLQLHGLDPNRMGVYLNVAERPRAPLWWSTENGYAALQDMRIPDPASTDSIGCGFATRFVVGAEYLVFRNASGGLLAPGFVSTGRPSRPPQRPIVERISGRNDPWLAIVRRAAASER